MAGSGTAGIREWKDIDWIYQCFVLCLLLFFMNGHLSQGSPVIVATCVSEALGLCFNLSASSIRKRHLSPNRIPRIESHWPGLCHFSTSEPMTVAKVNKRLSLCSYGTYATLGSWKQRQPHRDPEWRRHDFLTES